MFRICEIGLSCKLNYTACTMYHQVALKVQYTTLDHWHEIIPWSSAEYIFTCVVYDNHCHEYPHRYPFCITCDIFTGPGPWIHKGINQNHPTWSGGKWCSIIERKRMLEDKGDLWGNT